ncbi:hypothetical protein CY34DRAFT_800390, partial [Suillus luteus UH-Slu-Lm8-n1]
MNEEVDEWAWVLMTPKGRSLSRRWYRILRWPIGNWPGAGWMVFEKNLTRI